MIEYVSRVTLTLNGGEVIHLKSFKLGDLSPNVQVPLMWTTGFTRKTLRHTFDVEAAVPVSGKFDWLSVRDATLVVEDEGGARELYTGVATLDVKDSGADGDNARMLTITMGAADMRKE